MNHKMFVFSLLFVILGCSTTNPKGNNDSQNKPHVSVMTYNVEALFDTKDDPGKNDETYLPLTLKNTKKHKRKCAKARFKKWEEQCLNWDWNGKLLKTKLHRLADVIQDANDGAGPDILLLQEVENKAVLERLNKDHSLGFKEIILIEGKDVRGIDVAIMSKFELVGEPALHRIPFKNIAKDRVDDSRGILQATFRLPGLSLLTVFAAHFPAPFHPVQMRVEALKFLSKLLNKLPKTRLAIAGGDFNIAQDEDKKIQILDRYAAQYWTVAHKVGCKNCKGTSYYAKNDSWSFLDVLLVSKSFANHSKWQFDPSTVAVGIYTAEQIDEQGRPAEFDPVTLQGVSDHFPLTLKLTHK